VAEWGAQVAVYGLVFARCGGMLAVAPPLTLRQFPLALRLGIAGVLASALAAVAHVQPGIGAMSMSLYAALLVHEAVFGLATGFAAALVFHAFTVAGQLLDSYLEAADPGRRAAGAGPFATLTYALAAAIFVAIDGHHWGIAALARGLRAFPIGAPLALSRLDALGEAVGLMLGAGVAIAAPVLAAIYVAEVVLAAFDRLSPDTGLREAAMPVRWTTALLGFVAAAPLFAALVSRHGTAAIRALSAAAALLGGR